MSVIIRASGNIGPFKNIEAFPDTLPDRLRCDGVDYPFSVLGPHSVSQDDGLAPAPLPKPAAAPQEVPQWAAEIALVDANLLDEVEAAIAAVTPPGQKKKIEILWNKRPTIQRDSPVIAVMKTVIPLTDAELDQLFIDAQALVTLYASK